MMYININDEPLKKYNSIPHYWEKAGYQYAETHYEDGFRELIEPDYDSKTEKLGELEYDSDEDKGTWKVVAKSQPEIDNLVMREARQSQRLALDTYAKKVIQEEAQAFDDEDAVNFPHLYPFFEDIIGQTIPERFKLQAMNEDNDMVLWKALSEHEVKAEFAPKDTNYLYVETWADDVIPVFVPPTGYETAYNEGEKVWFPTENDDIYQSKIDRNTWSPSDAPEHWEKL